MEAILNQVLTWDLCKMQIQIKSNKTLISLNLIKNLLVNNNGIWEVLKTKKLINLKYRLIIIGTLIILIAFLKKKSKQFQVPKINSHLLIMILLMNFQ